LYSVDAKTIFIALDKKLDFYLVYGKILGLGDLDKLKMSFKGIT